MEAFIISVMMSATPYLMGLVLVIYTLIFINDKFNKNIPVLKISGIALIFILVYASIQPSNTYKFRVNKTENPSLVEKIVPEMQLTKPLIEQKKEERQKRFDDLTSWRKNVE